MHRKIQCQNSIIFTLLIVEIRFRSRLNVDDGIEHLEDVLSHVKTSLSKPKPAGAPGPRGPPGPDAKGKMGPKGETGTQGPKGSRGKP